MMDPREEEEEYQEDPFPTETGQCTGAPPPPVVVVANHKKSTGSLRRNSFSATELTNLQALEDDRISALYDNVATIENRRISWYDGAIKEDSSSESLSLTNLDDDDSGETETATVDEGDDSHDDDNGGDGNSSCSAASSTTNSDCASSQRLRKQPKPKLRLNDTKPLFYISTPRDTGTPQSPSFSRSFSNDITPTRKSHLNVASSEDYYSTSSSATHLPINNNKDRLAVTKSYPRKASEPFGLQQTGLSLSTHFLRGGFLSTPKTSAATLLTHPNVAGLGYHASASAALRRGHRSQGGPNPSASVGGSPAAAAAAAANVLGLSAYDNHLAKRSNTERVMEIQHPMKGTLSHMQGLMDSAFALMSTDVPRSIVEGAQLANEVMSKAWLTPKYGRNLAYCLCDYLREMGYFDLLIKTYCEESATPAIREAAGQTLEKCTSSANRAYITNKDFLDDVVASIKTFKEGAGLRIGVSLLEALFKDNPLVNARLIKLEALDYVLDACKKTADESSKTFRHAALALVSLSMSSDSACQQAMLAKNVPEWLFFVASCNDDLPRYYACIAICALVTNKEIEAAVIKSGTLSIVEPFLLSHQPSDFAYCDYRYSQGRPKEWLQRLVPMLNGKRKEPRSVAAFHFALEAEVRKDHLEPWSVLEEIGAVEALKRVAALPEEVAPKFASQALQIIGEAVPRKLNQRVPEWTVEDVQYWVTKTGFEEYARAFNEQRVDGDLLLLLTEDELARDIGMTSGLLRKRFVRELDSLKMVADYRSIDDTKLDNFLVSIHPRFSIYTYRLLEMGVDRSVLPSLSEEILRSECLVSNPVHRTILCQALEAQTNIDDVELALLRKKIDIFISYRRSTGNQLASLIKVLLQLRGYKVFIDVERLPAGQFDTTLLKNIQAAKHFVLVLSPGSLDRCVGDDFVNDWVHKEVLCALEGGKNIIPVFDSTFEFPEETSIPADMRAVTKFNGLRWVHEYQDACVDKLEKFINGDFNDGIPLVRRSSMRRSNSKVSMTTGSGSGSGSGGTMVTSPSTSDLLALANRSRTSSMNGDSTPPILSYQHQQSTNQALPAPDIIIDYCV